MRALVTGASGFLGRRLVWQLHSLGHRPLVLSPSTAATIDVEGVGVDNVTGDVTDRAALEAPMGRVDVVFHTAEQSELGVKDPAVLERVNVEGSRNVFDVAVRAGVPVVHVSSVTAYGPTGPDPQDETYRSDVEPASELDRSRRDALVAAREFRAHGADIRIAAAGTVYGPGDPSPLGRLTKLYTTVPLPVVPLRDSVWSTVNVDDCADGVIRVGELATPGEEYILAAETVTVKEWVEALAAAADKPVPLAHISEGVLARASRLVEWGIHAAGGPHQLIAELVATASRSYAYSGAKARAQLGWNPRPLDVGLAQLAAAYGASPTAR